MAKAEAEESAYARMTEEGEMFDNLYPVFEQTKSATYASSLKVVNVNFCQIAALI